jgi:hypothetical protein
MVKVETATGKVAGARRTGLSTVKERVRGLKRLQGPGGIVLGFFYHNTSTESILIQHGLLKNTPFSDGPQQAFRCRGLFSDVWLRSAEVHPGSLNRSSV